MKCPKTLLYPYRVIILCELFQCDVSVISKHLRNIFTSGELVREATVSKMETVQVEGSRTVVRTQEFFNLDVIIAVGG